MRCPLGLGLLAFLTACQPPSVAAVDAWLTAYGEGDAAKMVEHMWSGDRELVSQAMAELTTNPTSTLAMALPPKPIEFELIEIEKKEAGRHTVLTVVTMKNPLPYVSKRVGQDLSNIPKTRPERRRFLSVQEGERWGVKLDLPAALARLQFLSRFERTLAKRDYPEAAKMLKALPPPPDEPNALRSRDRLQEALTERLEARLERRRSRSRHVASSTTSTTAKSSLNE